MMKILMSKQKALKCQCTYCKKRFDYLKQGFQHFKVAKDDWGGLLHLEKG